MRNLTMEALADALNSWGVAETVSGTAGEGAIDVVISGHMDGYTLVIDEPLTFDYFATTTEPVLL